MKIAGVIAEYNPFHSGHEYQLAQTRERFGATHIAVCMSGSFTQRGDCACVSKFARAKTAVQCGADLVIELPVPWAVAPAGRFATGAVSLINALGCVDMLSFGSESGDIQLLNQTADAVLKVENELYKYLLDGGSLASARFNLIRKKFGDEISAPLSRPNDTLAIEYILAVRRLSENISCCPISRIGVEHDSTTAQKGFASASLIRTMLNDNSWQKYVPEISKKIIDDEVSLGYAPADMLRLERAILAKLRTFTPEDYIKLYEVSEGLENRIHSAVRHASSLHELYDSVKTKRYSHSRIRRIILSAFLGIDGKITAGLPPYISVLAMNERGREILAAARPTLPIVSRYADVKKLSPEAAKVFELECRATDLWALSIPTPAPCGLDCTSKLIVI